MNTRPTRIIIDKEALSHNIVQIKKCTQQQIIAMVKANAYGCGIAAIIPTLIGQVAAFGVASLAEALAVRELDAKTPCILFQGIFCDAELAVLVDKNLESVVHQRNQLQWILASPLKKPIKVWVKVDTGMHRLGFNPSEVPAVVSALSKCPWVQKPIGLITHFANADDASLVATHLQRALFASINTGDEYTIKSAANSAALLQCPASHFDAVRPGIIIYGVSPFASKTGKDLGLKPVMQFISAVSAIHHYPAGSKIGYGGTHTLEQDSIVGIVPVGYGDGYPRHVSNGVVRINNGFAPIVGTICMDMLTVDLSRVKDAKIGTKVELWGAGIPVERVAASAKTIAYELLCQVTTRGRGIDYSLISATPFM